MNYRDLEIWKLANVLIQAIHEVTLNKLPSFENFETGSQIRRSSKSIKANIVEGYGRRQYKKDFLHFLIIAQASLDETRDHLETLYETGSLRDKTEYDRLMTMLDALGRKLYFFIKSVETNHKSRPFK